MADHPRPRRFPVLWQVNARTTVRRLGVDATLDSLDDAQLDQLVPTGVDWLYLLGVWQTRSAGREVSRHNPDIRRSCEDALPDVRDEDICGSCFAVTGYQVHEHLGGDDALAGLRSRLADRGIALMLDFVPNHTAPDHPWMTRACAGTQAERSREQGSERGPRVGRVAIRGGRSVRAACSSRSPARGASCGSMVG